MALLVIAAFITRPIADDNYRAGGQGPSNGSEFDSELRDTRYRQANNVPPTQPCTIKNVRQKGKSAGIEFETKLA